MTGRTLCRFRTLGRVLSAGDAGGHSALRYPGPVKLLILYTGLGIFSSLKLQFERPANAEIPQLGLMLGFIGSYYPWIALTPVVFWLEKRFPLGSGQWLRNVGILTLISLPLCALASPVMLWSFFKGMSIAGATLTYRGQIMWFKHVPFAEILSGAAQRADTFSARSISFGSRKRRRLNSYLKSHNSKLA